VNDIVRFHLVQGNWLPPIKREVGVTGAHFHCAVQYEGSFYIFGGRNNSYTNELCRYEVISETWSKIHPNGKLPSPRFGASSVIYKDFMIIFGGYDNMGMSCNDLHRYHIPSNTWNLMNVTGEKPSCRFHSFGIVVNNFLYIIGGLSDNLKDVPKSEFLFQLDLETNNWNNLKTKGKIPLPCHGHSCFYLSSNIYLFGGYNKEKNQTLDHIYKLNLNKLKWKHYFFINISTFSLLSFNFNC